MEYKAVKSLSLSLPGLGVGVSPPPSPARVRAPAGLGRFLWSQRGFPPLGSAVQSLCTESLSVSPFVSLSFFHSAGLRRGFPLPPALSDSVRTRRKTGCKNRPSFFRQGCGPGIA